MEQESKTKPVSVAELASDACAMPWEDKAPFSVRYAFKEAITPELFTELVEALEMLLEAPKAGPAITAARAALSRAKSKE